MGNLRRYLIALLAAVYAVTWWLLGVRAPAKPDEEARAPEPLLQTGAEQGTATWFHDLPAAERPVVNVPVGWHIADRTASSPTVTARVAPTRVRVPRARAGRIRTRSS